MRGTVRGASGVVLVLSAKISRQDHGKTKEPHFVAQLSSFESITELRACQFNRNPTSRSVPRSEFRRMRLLAITAGTGGCF
jgi:hypothetical protein